MGEGVARVVHGTHRPSRPARSSRSPGEPPRGWDLSRPLGKCSLSAQGLQSPLTALVTSGRTSGRSSPPARLPLFTPGGCPLHRQEASLRRRSAHRPYAQTPLKHPVLSLQHSQCPWHAVPRGAQHLRFPLSLLHLAASAVVHASLPPPQQVRVASQTRPGCAQPLPLLTGRALAAVVRIVRSTATAPSTAPASPRSRRRREPPVPGSPSSHQTAEYPLVSSCSPIVGPWPRSLTSSC
jgi:hypothetical protein